MGQIELKITFIAGLVVSLFLIVGEIAALRTQVSRLRLHWKHLRDAGRRVRYGFEILGVCLFFLIQPPVVGGVLVYAVNGFTPVFSVRLMGQVRDRLSPQQ